MYENHSERVRDMLSINVLALATVLNCKVIELKCNPNYDVQKIVSLPYRCIVGFSCFYEDIHTDENTNIVINFDETNYSLDCIGFVNTTLNELPSNLFNKYQAVNSIYASSTGLKTLAKTTFENATKMLDIDLSGNNLKSLEENVFSPCKLLRKLVLSGNELEEIDMNTFDGLDHLEEIDLSGNVLKNIPHKSLGQLKGLKILNLSKNMLNVHYGMFPFSLVSLDLSYNNLENFTLKSIISLENLKFLNLNGNKMFKFRLHIFPDGILGTMKSLKHIQLSDNNLYCTILADVVIWLDKHKVKIDVEPHFFIANASNIRGVGCREEQIFF
ncbi:unnamed protein product [Diamesa hyperborea]